MLSGSAKRRRPVRRRGQWRSVQSRHPVLALLVLAAVATWSCSAGAVVPRSNRYSNPVDGITGGWPRGWERVERELTTFTGGAVDLMVLATFDPPVTTDQGCAQDAPAAIAAMRHGDALFRLQTVSHLVPDRPASSRSQSFFGAAEPVDWAGGCKPRGVVALQVAFESHGRLYEAVLMADSPLQEKRRREIETIWATLEVGPIATARDSAHIGRSYWHEVSTHCGVIWTEFDGRNWVADPPLTGEGNLGPPPGWKGPSEVGTIRLVDEHSALFESRDGNRSARFRPRVPADPPLRGCE